MWDSLNTLLGIHMDPKDLSILQVCLRGLLIFFIAIAIVRVADKRFLSRKTAFDAVLGFVLASMLARAINGSAAFFPTIVCGFLLVLAHRTLAWAAARWRFVGSLVKGHDECLIHNGRINKEMLRRHNISEHDLEEDLRLKSVGSPADVAEAWFERSGEISVIRKSN
jgi:uncharacterized membrane protein YcaP (DUF421 family)